jgi:hypothetical protein
VVKFEKRFYGVKLGGEAQLNGIIGLREVADGLGEGSGQVLDAERVGVAGRLECGALVPALDVTDPRLR